MYNTYDQVLKTIDNSIADIPIYPNMSQISEIGFLLTSEGYVHYRVFTNDFGNQKNDRVLSSVDLSYNRGNKGYFKTLSGCKRNFLYNFKNCYFDNDGTNLPVDYGRKIITASIYELLPKYVI